MSSHVYVLKLPKTHKSGGKKEVLEVQETPEGTTNTHTSVCTAGSSRLTTKEPGDSAPSGHLLLLRVTRVRESPSPVAPTLPKLPLPRTLMKLKSFRVLLWTCPSSLPAEDEDEEVVDEEDEQECWGPCWSRDSAACRRSSPARSGGGGQRERGPPSAVRPVGTGSDGHIVSLDIVFVSSKQTKLTFVSQPGSEKMMSNHGDQMVQVGGGEEFIIQVLPL